MRSARFVALSKAKGDKTSNLYSSTEVDVSQQLLQYALQLSQVQANNVATNLTYVNTGQAATLTILVSNKGADATITSIDFGLGPFGQDGTDLAASPNDVKAVLPDGWKIVPGTSFTVEPTAGSAVIGTTSVTFVFQVNVNAAPGTSSLTITEVSTAGTAHVYPIPITKMPSSFTLANLSATPTLVEPNASVTLSWDCSESQLYTIGYPGGTSTYTSPAGGGASWVAPPVVSTYPNITYTVSASTQVSGQTLSAELSTTVNVDVADIISFPQPSAFYSSPVTLHWQTTNTDYVVVYANGIVVDPNAPANPGPSGYQTSPGGHSTAYQIRAYRNGVPSSPSTIYVTLYQWSYERTFGWGDVSAAMALALNADGSVLYFGGNWGVTAIDTNAFTVIEQGVINAATTGPMPWGVSNSGLALSRDGTTLYAGVIGGQVLAFQTANLAAPPTTIAVNGGPLALSPDGSTLYVGVNQWGTTSNGTVYAVSTATNAVTQQVNLPGSWATTDLKLSSDGATLYVMGWGSDQANSPLFSINTSTFVATQVTTAVTVPIALTRDDATLYCGLTANWGTITTNIQALAIPGFTQRNTVTPLATPGPNPNDTYATIIGMATDPSGGLFVSIMCFGVLIGGQNIPSVLYFVNPSTMAVTQLSTLGIRPNANAIVVDNAGNRAYYANGIEIVVFTSSGGGA